MADSFVHVQELSNVLFFFVFLVSMLEKPALSVDSFVGYNSSVMSATPFPLAQ